MHAQVQGGDGWEFSLGRVRAFEGHVVGAQVGPRGMAGLERGRVMGTHMPAQDSEWRAANGGGGPEPSQLEVVQEHHGFWRWVSLGGDCGDGSVLREMGVTRGRVWEMGGGGPRRVGGPSTGDLGWAELGLVSSSGLGQGSEVGSGILQCTTLNPWAWTLRPFSEWCCLPLMQ